MSDTTIMMKREIGFDYLMDNSWSGAIYTLEKVREHEKEEELMSLIAEAFNFEIPTETEINDFLWFEDEFIFESLGINEEEEEEEEE